MNEATVRSALNAIVDPCSATAGMPAGLVDMGLVRSLEVRDGSGGAVVRVGIGVTEPGCLMGVPFAREAEKRLGGLPGMVGVEVILDHAHDWEPQDMSPQYRKRHEDQRAVRRRALRLRLDTNGGAQSGAGTGGGPQASATDRGAGGAKGDGRGV
ncbi:MAG: hypothetical protein AVDCRST_MAG83-3388 [uncultured Arthrobacter sp.]|uniref:MIP18 family-like domain-containing protein n=1 Tax=uncultured Arthrobacter sp. TaxID=114050 RepID=A0A6J4J7Q3_9MICC|nr:iron-sulfur cluster assembly protein [uncultured Arthrobacter sp.]CAA9273017.1 MAG: hypothetical protein AVDCRST_MAG83-3388 [uncultured Arthrobacter sp.]